MAPFKPPKWQHYCLREFLTGGRALFVFQDVGGNIDVGGGIILMSSAYDVRKGSQSEQLTESHDFGSTKQTDWVVF